MPLSTSSSNPGPKQGRWFLLSLVAIGILVAIYGLMELATRRFLVRSSKILSRIEADRKTIFEPASGKPRLLLAGNSLLLFGIDMDLLRQRLGSEYDVRRYSVEQTAFLDWKYGYRRLVREGVKADHFLLMLSGRQFVGGQFRRDQFAFHQLSTPDYWQFVSESGLHPTDATGQLFAHVSHFYANRSDIRKFILSKLVPNLGDLTTKLAPIGGPLNEREVYEVSQQRLRWFDEETKRNGMRFTLILPPTKVPAYSEPVAAAGRAAGAETLYPITGDAFPAGEFLDGHHLNELGAKRFTESLAAELKKRYGHNGRVALRQDLIPADN